MMMGFYLDVENIISRGELLYSGTGDVQGIIPWGGGSPRNK
jgi:hypothetical protein